MTAAIKRVKRDGGAISSMRVSKQAAADNRRTASRAAIRLFSAMVGALILARAVDDEVLSRRILQAVADGLKGSTTP